MFEKAYVWQILQSVELLDLQKTKDKLKEEITEVQQSQEETKDAQGSSDKKSISVM